MKSTPSAGRWSYRDQFHRIEIMKAEDAVLALTLAAETLTVKP
jgi:hypothetical protein